MLTQEYLKECLDYNPDTGVFIWKERPRHHFPTKKGYSVFCAQFAGKAAGGLARNKSSKTDYLQIKLKGKWRKLHRVAWLYFYGEMPSKDLDHINGDGMDNRICNLRLADNALNRKNMPKQWNNTSGVTGISWAKHVNKWQAYIKINYKKVHLGYRLDKFEAICLRKSAEIKYSFHENHGR